MNAIPANLQRWTLKRIDDSFIGFFSRIKKGEKPGFPRFRGRERWNSFGFAAFSGIRFDGKRLRFKGLLGGCVVNMTRALPIGADIRSCVFQRRGRQWHICFQIAISMPTKREVRTAIGIDLGLKVFAHASDGVVIPNPRIARKAEKEMRRRQRALSRCRRGSSRRKKVRAQVSKIHQKIVDTRTTWLHQQSAALVRRADLIVVEKLNIRGMIQHPTLARSISDVSWSKFLGMVKYKAEGAGASFITINPRNTSKACSGCGVLVPKSLAVRMHSCPSCGLVIDRDHNASLNILAAGIGRGAVNVVHQDVRRLGNMCGAP